MKIKRILILIHYVIFKPSGGIVGIIYSPDIRQRYFQHSISLPIHLNLLIVISPIIIQILNILTTSRKYI